MDSHLFNEFVSGDDTLRVYENGGLIFASNKERLLPLLEYIDTLASSHQGVVIMDKIMGNAAALLSILAGGREVCSPLGSQLAVRTLATYGVEHHITETIDYILKPGGEDMCPMERLSIDKNPEEFYMSLKKLTR